MVLCTKCNKEPQCVGNTKDNTLCQWCLYGA